MIVSKKLNRSLGGFGLSGREQQPLNHLATVTGAAVGAYEAPEEAGAAGRERRIPLGAVS